MANPWIIGLLVVIFVIIGGIILFLLLKYLFNTPDPINPEPPTACYSGDGPTENQTAALRFTNHCCTTVWVEARAGPCSSPLPGKNTTLFKLEQGNYIDFDIPPNGLAATRFWAKYGCDDNGTNCAIGDQVPTWTSTDTCPSPYGCVFETCPAGPCPANGCTPPIDTLFEATWGCTTDTADCNFNTSACTGGCVGRPCSSGGCDFLPPVTSFDSSQVDGFTFPYKLYLKGSPEDIANCNNGAGGVNIDASQLYLANCPTSDDLSDYNNYPTVINNNLNPPVTYSTTSVNLQFTSNNQIVGCFSPCQKLTNGSSGFGQLPGTYPTVYYCCPTPDPNDCNLPQCITPDGCSNGPVVDTQYVRNVHSMAPGVYAFQYDDGNALQNCEAGKVIYEFELCGKSASPYPVNIQ